MHDVAIRSRADGIVELTPRAAALPAGDRILLVTGLVLVASGLFVSGVLRAEALAAIVLSALAGELVVGAKSAILAILRPRAEVHEVARFRGRRR
jgi:uncharacterized membrane protein